MELVDHGSLDDLMESQGRLPEHQVLDIGIQIARGLRAAHRKGLIHRDVKPANILFADEQAAKIGDFGLAAFCDTTVTEYRQRWCALGNAAICRAGETLQTSQRTFAATFTALAQRCFMLSLGKAPIEAAQIPRQSCTH